MKDWQGGIVMEEKIYLLLSDTGTILTKLIKAYTKKPYNHASIAFDSELKAVYSFGRKMIKNPFIGGFVREDMNSSLFQQANFAIYSLPVSKAEMRQMKHYIQRMETQKEDYHYNFLGLFGVMLNTPVKRKNSFFCSQFVATILDENGVFDVKIEPSLVKPSDLPLLTDFQLIYEGRLKDYQGGGILEGDYSSYTVGAV